MAKLISNLLLGFFLVSCTSSVLAADYTIDTKGAHAFVQFRVKHLGYSWLYGRFNKFDGEFTYDEKDDSKNKISMTVDVTSLDSMHAERDKHLRDDRFLNVPKFSTAKFVSTQYKSAGGNKATLTGKLTLMGVIKDITLDVDVLGGGDDPWGGYRHGFEAKTTLSAKEFGIKKWKIVGDVELTVSVEGIRK